MTTTRAAAAVGGAVVMIETIVDLAMPMTLTRVRPKKRATRQYRCQGSFRRGRSKFASSAMTLVGSIPGN